MSTPDVLFEIRENQLETGLRGYPVGYCTTSTVDPIKGLFYAGYPLSQLSDCTAEEVLFLLFYGRLSDPKEQKSFQKELQSRAICSPDLLAHITQLPRTTPPMKLLSIALLLAGSEQQKFQYAQDALTITAQIPEMVAAIIRHHAGWGSPKASQPDLGYIENFVHLLDPPHTYSLDSLKEAFRLFNILHYDHGGGNLSAFVGKAVASGLEDMYGSLAAAMCALAGPRHGRANQDCLQFLEQLLQEIGPVPEEAILQKRLEEKLAQGQLIFGFGHAVLRTEDPRATLLYTLCEKKYSAHPLVQLALLLRRVGSFVLAKSGKISDPHPNVDAISGTLLSAAGFPYPDYFTLLFGMARIAGISRQIVYERMEARGGKGTPIVRPKYVFKKLESPSSAPALSQKACDTKAP